MLGSLELTRQCFGLRVSNGRKVLAVQGGGSPRHVLTADLQIRYWTLVHFAGVQVLSRFRLAKCRPSLTVFALEMIPFEYLIL